MTIALGAVADDYTGASDLANTLTRNGLRTIQTIGVPASNIVLPEVDAVVVALKTRSVAAAEAVARSREAAGWLQAQGAAHILFKICSTFDSTPAGNIGPVTDALADDAGADLVLVTPAFPETGRTVYQGYLFVGAVPLDESPLRDHPLNPMFDANLLRVLGAQSRRKIGLLPFNIIEQGAAAVCARLAELTKAGFGAAIADALTERHLLTLGEIALASPLSTGASGLGLGLARALVAQGRVSPVQSGNDPFAKPVGGRAAILAGSCSEATRGQIAAIEAKIPVLRLDIPALLAGADIVQPALAWADRHLGQSPVLIASSAAPETVAQTREQHQGESAGTTIETALAGIAAGLVDRGVRRLIVAGGETSGAVTDRLEIGAFLVGGEIAPGVPMLRTLGCKYGGCKCGDMLLALKSGNFGGPDFFDRALAMMR